MEEIAKILNEVQDQLKKLDENMEKCREYQYECDMIYLFNETIQQVLTGYVIFIDWAKAILDERKKINFSKDVIERPYCIAIEKCEKLLHLDATKTGYCSYIYVANKIAGIYLAFNIPIPIINCVNKKCLDQFRTKIPIINYVDMNTKYEEFNQLLATFEEHVKQWEKWIPVSSNTPNHN